MGTSFGRAVIYSLQAVAPQKQAEHVNIWKYDAPEYFLKPASRWEDPFPFMLERSHVEIPSHEFKIRYFSRRNENPIKDSLPVQISTRNRQVIGLCGLSVDLIIPQFAKHCIDKWVFAKREEGGFYIKPFNDPLLCMNAYGPGIRVETCRTDWPSMSFMYGNKIVRENFLVLKDLVDITHNPERKKELKNILDTGSYMYDSMYMPPEMPLNTQPPPISPYPSNPYLNSQEPLKNTYKSPPEEIKKEKKKLIRRSLPYRKPKFRNFKKRYYNPRHRALPISHRDKYTKRTRRTRFQRKKVVRKITTKSDDDDPYVRKSTMMKYMRKMNDARLDTSVLNKLRKVISEHRPMHKSSIKERNRELEDIIRRLEAVSKKARLTLFGRKDRLLDFKKQDRLLDPDNCDSVFCPEESPVNNPNK